MKTLQQMEKQQIGLRLPTYLVNEIDELTSEYNINRSTFITEAVANFVQEQKEQLFYERLEQSIKEMKMIMNGELPKITLQETIDELRNN